MLQCHPCSGRLWGAPASSSTFPLLWVQTLLRACRLLASFSSLSAFQGRYDTFFLLTLFLHTIGVYVLLLCVTFTALLCMTQFIASPAMLACSLALMVDTAFMSLHWWPVERWGCHAVCQCIPCPTVCMDGSPLMDLTGCRRGNAPWCSLERDITWSSSFTGKRMAFGHERINCIMHEAL